MSSTTTSDEILGNTITSDAEVEPSRAPDPKEQPTSGRPTSAVDLGDGRLALVVTQNG